MTTFGVIVQFTIVMSHLSKNHLPVKKLTLKNRDFLFEIDTQQLFKFHFIKDKNDFQCEE